MIELGDMIVTDEPPPHLLRALAVIADRLHVEFERQDWITPGKSKESCVLCSLAVLDFLHAIGFDDARAESVVAIIRADRDGRELHSVGIGIPGKDDVPDRWNGHLVVTCGEWLIDPTLYQARRPHWEFLGMFATRIRKHPHRKIKGLRVRAFVEMIDGDDPSFQFGVAWLSNPKNTRWEHGPDAEPWRRAVVTARLAAKYKSVRNGKPSHGKAKESVSG
jgi:hypothetical protein